MFGRSGWGTLVALSAMFGGFGPTIYRGQEKLPKKCLLPSCDASTTHNGGYCSAEHAKKHKEILKSGVS